MNKRCAYGLLADFDEQGLRIPGKGAP